MRFILASESPRRISLLKKVGINEFDIIPSITPEVIDKNISPVKALKQVAKNKVLDVVKRYKFKEDVCVIGGDTAVVYNYEIIGKPRTYKEEHDILRKLSNDYHLVITGLYVYTKVNGVVKDKNVYSISMVKMRSLSEDEINAYLMLNTFWDKAGGYSIEEDPLNFIEGYSGDYTNILGLPLIKLNKVFKELGIEKQSRGKRINKKAQ